MPSIIEVLTDPVSLIIIGLYFLLFLIETVKPARNWPQVRYWKIKGITLFFIYFLLATYLPMIWDASLVSIQLFDLSEVSVLAGTLIGLFIYEIGLYLWHRAMHSSDLLWRVFHQMHHSGERMDIPSAFYFSPMDIVAFSILGSLCFSLLVGLPPMAVTNSLLIINFLGLLQHANIKTPQWLGYLVQRPESHSLHHARGIHKYNYCDLPIIDMIFGTFRNPAEFQEETGLYPGASAKVRDMLIFKDITANTSNES